MSGFANGLPLDDFIFFLVGQVIFGGSLFALGFSIAKDRQNDKD